MSVLNVVMGGDNMSFVPGSILTTKQKIGLLLIIPAIIFFGIIAIYGILGMIKSLISQIPDVVIQQPLELIIAEAIVIMAVIGLILIVSEAAER